MPIKTIRNNANRKHLSDSDNKIYSLNQPHFRIESQTGYHPGSIHTRGVMCGSFSLIVQGFAEYRIQTPATWSKDLIVRQYDIILAVCCRQSFIRQQRIKLLFKTSRITDIVRILNNPERASNNIERLIQSTRSSRIILPKISDSDIACHKFFIRRNTIIRASVIYHHQFEIVVSLIQNTCNRRT